MVHSYISAIKAVLLVNGIELDENSYLLSVLTHACKFTNDKVRLHMLIHKSILKILLNKLVVLYDQQPYLKSLYLAMFSTAYFGLFHVGEITKSDHVVKANDVFVAMNKKKIQFILCSSKTHGKYNLPQKIKISSQETKLPQTVKQQGFCPYLLL